MSFKHDLDDLRQPLIDKIKNENDDVEVKVKVLDSTYSLVYVVDKIGIIIYIKRGLAVFNSIEETIEEICGLIKKNIENIGNKSFIEIALIKDGENIAIFDEKI